MIGYLEFVGVFTAFNGDGMFGGILDSPSELPGNFPMQWQRALKTAVITANKRT